jgi:hypothetical protein
MTEKEVYLDRELSRTQRALAKASRQKKQVESWKRKIFKMLGVTSDRMAIEKIKRLKRLKKDKFN